MTDGFTATIAATVPVIVLTGIVEVREVFSRTSELERERERRGVPFARRPWREGEEPDLRTALLPLTHWLYRHVAVIWVVVLVYLLVAEVFALKWLATPNAGPHPQQADSCFQAVVLGIGVIVIAPLLRFMHRFVMSAGGA